MSNIFQTELSAPQSQMQVFKQLPSESADNSVANTINAITGLAQIGTKAYQEKKETDLFKGYSAEVAKVLTARDQGKIKAGAADIQLNNIATQHIVANPQHTDRFRSVLTTMAGTNIQAEIDESARHEADAAQARGDTVFNSGVQFAAQLGYAPRSADGSFNQEKMFDFGTRARARDAKAAALKARNSSTSAGEREDIRRTSFEKELYADFGESKVKLLKESISEWQRNNPEADPGTDRDLAIVLTQGVEASANEVRELALNSGMTHSDANAFEIQFRKDAKVWTSMFTGDKAASKLAKEWVDFADTTATMSAIEQQPLIHKASMIGLKPRTTNVTKLKRLFAPSDSMSSTEYKGDSPATLNDVLRSSVKVLADGGRFRERSVEEQEETYIDSVAYLNQQLPQFEAASPDVRNGITNALGVHIEVANQTDNLENAVKFANYYNQPKVKLALERLNKDSNTSDKVMKISDERLKFVVDTINKTKGEFKYNPTTGTTDNLYINSLLGNLNTFYAYSSPKDTPLDTFKNELFGVTGSSSTE